jgi:CheY-like chemotaxis protein
VVDNERKAIEKKAIEKKERNSYDVVLMDLHMPEMNGFEATAYKRDTLHSNLPIIALSADVTTVDLDKCKSFGMNGYLSKPIDEGLLHKRIIQYL